ncbi:amino acid kinase, partial [Candidatus Micrarchaeota archaeon]|nr:amino acid kinase [Candidatus Micrarchaeota archaeon]
GAGAFGHKLVSDYRINNGLKSEMDFEGYRKTQESVKGLDDIVVGILKEGGLRVEQVIPHEVIVQENKRIIEFDLSGVERILKEKGIPVMYGDMVKDKALKGSVVSGDKIIAFLSKELKPERILLGTDVDGIYSADPKKNPKAEIIKEINEDNYPEVIKKVEGSMGIDVTRGMKGKLEEIRENCEGVEIIVFNALKEGNLYKLLSGEKGIGTRIFFG